MPTWSRAASGISLPTRPRPGPARRAPLEVVDMFKEKAIPAILIFAAVLVLSGGVSLAPGGVSGPSSDLDLASEACTVIMVGREASTDGSVMSCLLYTSPSPRDG